MPGLFPQKEKGALQPAALSDKMKKTERKAVWSGEQK
jgi:hypothetical protein